MTNIAAIVRAAQRALAEQPQPDWADVDSLSDEQLEMLAGPGHGECSAWDQSGSLPGSTPGLMLLAGMIEAAAESQIRLELRRAAGPGYTEFEAWALNGQPPKTAAGKRLVEAVQAAAEEKR